MKNNFNFNHEIKRISGKYNLSIPFSLECLTDDNLVVYLNGKSGNGKTALLNAILDLKRNEFYENTNVATKTKYILSYGKEKSYRVRNENPDFRLLPVEFEERQNLLSELNNKGTDIDIKLPSELLKKIYLIDIPGFFDYTNDETFKKNLIYDAELVVFLKYFRESFSQDELSYLKELETIGIQYLLVYTFSDLFEPKEVTYEEYYDFLLDRSKSLPKPLEVFWISVEEFYRNPQKGKLIELKEYITKEYRIIKNKSCETRKQNIRSYITEALNEKISFNMAIIINELKKRKDLGEVDISRESLKQKDLRDELLNHINEETESLYMSIYNYLYSKEKNEIGLQETWKNSWKGLIAYLKNYSSLLNNSIFDVPTLPEVNKRILDCSIDLYEDISNLINDLSSNNDKDDTKRNIEILNDIYKKIKAGEKLTDEEIDTLKRILWKDKQGNKGYLVKSYEYSVYYLYIGKFLSSVKKVVQKFKENVEGSILIDINIRGQEAELNNEIIELENKLISEFGIQDLKNDIDFIVKLN